MSEWRGKCFSLKRGKLGVGVFEDALQNLTALVDGGKSFLGVRDRVLRQALPMLDEVLLDDLYHVVRAAADPAEVAEQLR